MDEGWFHSYQKLIYVTEEQLLIVRQRYLA